MFFCSNFINNNANHLNPSLSPHGQTWIEVDEIGLEIAQDVRHIPKTRLNWSRVPGMIDVYAEKSPFNYFELLWPLHYDSVVVNATNVNLNNAHKALMTKGEFLQFLGIEGARALDPVRGGIEEYWRKSGSAVNSIFAPRDYGTRFEMSLVRYKQIAQALEFHSGGETLLQVFTFRIFYYIFNII
jgi:hypothetical protein